MEIGLKCLLIVFVAASVADGFHIFRQSSFCNGQRKYLELGESGQLSAYNISVPNYIEEATRSLNKSLTVQCSLELVTCPSCIIKLKFNYVDFPKRCKFENGSGSICPCDHIMISEPPYDTQSNIIHNCGNMLEVQSRTRSILLRFVYSSNYTDAFQVEYQSLRNRQEINMNDVNDERDVTSPFFPSFYPRDYSVEHVVSCTDITATCRVHLEFSDFQLARSSSMEFYDTNGERLFVNGKTFRPPVLISSGPSLMIRFFANGDTDVGYKAKASFLTVDQSNDPELKPRVGCGGLVESVGGAITMMNMVEDSNESSSEVLFDCIWIIRPPQGYMHVKSHISIRVDTFEKMSSSSTIDIIGGSTSDRPILAQLISSPSKSIASRNLVVPITTGFYVRLRGAFNEESRLAIVYTTFSYSKCYIGGEFLCANERCIPLILRCDGFSQCGDDSDELECTWANTRRYTHTPNYFFPKVERFPDFKTTTLAFIISCGSLVFVISCLIMTLYRNGNRVREQEEFQNQLQTISQLLEANNLRPTNENDEPPPNYEAPPNYDEIIKIGMDDQINKSKRERRSGRRSRQNRLDNSEQPITYQNGLLGVFDDNDLPSTSSSLSYNTSNLPQETLSSSLNVLENSEAAETSENQKGETIPAFLTFADIPSLLISSEFSTQVAPPNHLWSNDSKYRNSWILFNSEVNTEANAAKRSWHETQNAESLDDHMKFNQTLSIDQQGNHTSVIHECHVCKNLLLKKENRRGSLVCEGCIEKLYSVKICSFCNGRVSFQGLKNLTATKKNFNQETAEIDKLCICFPQEQATENIDASGSFQEHFVSNSSKVLLGSDGESSSDE